MDKKDLDQPMLIKAFVIILFSGLLIGYLNHSTKQTVNNAKLTTVKESVSKETDVDKNDVDKIIPKLVEAPSLTGNESSPVHASNYEIGHETFPEELIDDSPIITNRIALLSQMRRANSETFISRDDLPQELRQELDMAMEAYQRNGYFEIDESDIEKLDAPYNEVQAFDLDNPALTITIENIENTSLAEMEYIGVIPDKIAYTEDSPVPGIRRVFKNEAGYLSLLEADLKNSGALLQKEFVNKSINGYPATQITYCAPSMRCVTQLSWLTSNKRYELALRGDIEDLGEEGLVKIASSLDLPPAPQTQVK